MGEEIGDDLEGGDDADDGEHVDGEPERVTMTREEQVAREARAYDRGLREGEREAARGCGGCGGATFVSPTVDAALSLLGVLALVKLVMGAL